MLAVNSEINFRFIRENPVLSWPDNDKTALGNVKVRGSLGEGLLENQKKS